MLLQKRNEEFSVTKKESLKFRNDDGNKIKLMDTQVKELKNKSEQYKAQ